jgi:ATP-binding cassette subfamily D (ALD) long-chain fatty acid import protein
MVYFRSDLAVVLTNVQRNITPTSPQKFASDARHFPVLPPTVKPNIDMAFVRQLRAILLRIAFPRFRSKETLILILHSTFLVLRTVLSIAVAQLDGVIVRDLVCPFCTSKQLITHI